jgi:hypothetical protein
LAHRRQALPLTLPDGQRVGYAELVDFTLQTLYRAADWAAGRRAPAAVRHHKSHGSQHDSAPAAHVYDRK